jgi:predicted GNAT superfamily acetyltransferase
LAITYKDLSSLEEFARVVELERRIWGIGYEDVVPVPILAITVMRGGTLIGAFAGDGSMIGFVYGLAAMKRGTPTHWSHMLGVVDEYRSAGVGLELKRLQRDRVLAMKLDLVEWTYDPMQALNAHLNFAKLGVIVEEYEVNVYGTSMSPLHGGNPTDRFVAEWKLRDARVEQRVSGGGPLASVLAFAPALRATAAGQWLEPAAADLSIEARRVSVEIPTGFTDMLAQAPELALHWRMTTREIFTSYFGRGYRAVEFFLDRPARKGAYLLTRHS